MGFTMNRKTKRKVRKEGRKKKGGRVKEREGENLD